MPQGPVPGPGKRGSAEAPTAAGLPAFRGDSTLPMEDQSSLKLKENYT